MAVLLNATYSKKLGLPQYSSHSFSVSVQTEVTDLSRVPEECEELYARLQESVDQEIQKAGWLPGPSNGHHGNGSAPTPAEGSPNGAWNCSDKQRELILDLVDEHNLDRREVDTLARERFGKGVRELNKLEASGLIDELIEKHGGRNGRRGNGQRNGGGRYRRNPSPAGNGRRT